MAYLLEGYEDRDFLVKGFTEGFSLCFEGSGSSVEGRNALSVRRNTQEALKKVEGERALGRISGPFNSKPFDLFKCSPLSLRPKSSPGKFRLLHDLSFPYNDEAVNRGITDDNARVKYASVQDAVQILIQHPGAFLAKGDLKDAYRQVPLAPDQYWLVGFKLQGCYYHDNRLPMGARSSCAIFERVASALAYILRSKYRVRYVIKMLDDFLFLGATKEECDYGLVSFEHLCHRLNLPLAEEKTVRATRRLAFLGIDLDAEKQLASIPPEKALKYAREISALAGKSSCSLRDLRQVTGKLEHATCIIKGGRAFIRRLHEAKKGPQVPSRRIKISGVLKEDMLLWVHFFTKI